MNPLRRTPETTDLLFFLFALVGTMTSGFISLILLLWGMLGETGTPSLENLSGLWAGYAFGLMALLGLLALAHAAAAIFAPPAAPPRRPGMLALGVIFLFPLAIYLGYLAFYRQVAPALLAPLAQSVAAGVPVLFAIQLVRRYGPLLSPRRLWSQFLAGLWIVPPIALLIEAFLLIPTVVVVALGMTASEEGRALLQALASQDLGDIETFINQAAGLIFQPWLVVILLLFVALAVPLTEELLKTLPVWPLFLRRASPAEYFVGGVLAGAGYALFEALFLAAPGEEWLVTIIGRGGATMMHAIASGIAGWGLGQAAIYRRWSRMLASYGLAVIIHGLWNATAIAVGLVEIAHLTQVDGPVVRLVLALQPLLPGVLAAFSVAALLTLPWASRRLTQPDGSPPAAASPD